MHHVAPPSELIRTSLSPDTGLSLVLLVYTSMVVSVMIGYFCIFPFFLRDY